VSGKSTWAWGIAVAVVALSALSVRWFKTTSVQLRSARRDTESHSSGDPGEAAPAESAPAPVEATRNATTSPTDRGESGVAGERASRRGVVLHVRVVDGARQPQTSGRLDGLWSDDPNQPSSPASQDVHRFDAAITGATTDVVLPGAAESALLAASVAGQPPSARVPVFKLHENAEPADHTGTFERDVEIVVDGAVATPGVRGRILVDGQPRTPRGLEVSGAQAVARIHALEARYETGPITGSGTTLFVTSEETVPKYFPTGFSSSNPPIAGVVLERDLDLSSGVTLDLAVVDRKSLAPLPDVEFWIRIDCIPDGLPKSSQRSYEHHVVTGADGVAIVRGLARPGALSIRRDARRRQRRVERLPEPPLELAFPREPLLAEAIDASTPALIERTLRIDAQDRPCSAFGTLDPSFAAAGEFGEAEAEVRFATRSDDVLFQQSRRAGSAKPSDGFWMRSLASTPADAQGRWRLEIDPGVDYRVWVEREHRRVSEIAAVRAEDGDVGPVALLPRAGTPVLVRLLRCPTQGTLVIGVHDPGAVMPIATSYPAAGGTLERRVRIEGRTSINVSEFVNRPRNQVTRTKVVVVDPATTSLVEFDLAADEARTIRVTADSGFVPKETTLKLRRVLPEGTCEPFPAVSVPLVDGVTSEPVVVDPGRYLYSVEATPRPGTFVLGVVDVARGPVERPIEIRCELEPHPKSELGAGFDVTEIAGVRPGPDQPSLLHVHFAEEPWIEVFDPIDLPKAAHFTVLER
jgi:hypothetical protein